MLDWLARKLGLLAPLKPEEAEAERAERNRAAKESNARFVSAVAWAASTGCVCAGGLAVAHFLLPTGIDHRLASAILFSAIWGSWWFGWRSPRTWAQAIRRLASRS